MSTAQVVWLVVLLVVLVALGLAVAAVLRRRSARRAELQDRFGPEYGRTVAETGSRQAAERDLAEREHRHDQLHIRPLPEASRERYARSWAATQANFVDQPVEAVGDADRILGDVMRERGYPTESPDQAMADLSVEHADTLDHYREAHAVAERVDEATTEELRRAMQHYRTLVQTLVEDGPADGTGSVEATRL